MSKKRRDSKNRVLRSGESQRKDGRYAYKYIDTFGNPQFVYAWKLVPGKCKVQYEKRTQAADEATGRR